MAGTWRQGLSCLSRHSLKTTALDWTKIEEKWRKKKEFKKPSAFTFTCALFKVFGLDAVTHNESVALGASVGGVV